MFRKYLTGLTVLILFLGSSLTAVTLFEIKDEAGNPVLVVSSDGLRILNGSDTLMVITSSEIKAVVDESKGLSRTFSVTTASSKAGPKKVMDVQAGLGGMRVYNLGDTLMTISANAINANISSSKGLSRSFSVTTASSKGEDIKIFDVNTSRASLREGGGGDEYMNFSPENIFLGLNSGSSITTGTGNTFMGNNTGMSNSTGNNNVIIGDDAGKMYDNSFGNVFVGQDAAKNLYYGQRNVIMGYSAGSEPANSDSLYGNVYLGAVAGRKVRGSHNVMIGEGAGENYQTGGSSGYNNVFLGYMTGQHSTGHDNIYLGSGAGRGTSENVHTGSNNIYIGNDAGWADRTESNTFRLGHLMWGDLDGPMTLIVNGEYADNPNGYTFYVNGSAGGDYAWNNLSDERLKKNIRTIDNGLDKVMKLRGVTYEWKDENALEKGRRMGFIAQECENVIPEVVDHNNGSDRYSMQYANITAVLVEAVKDLKKQADSNVAALESKESENKKIIEGQNEKIGMLIKENNELKNKVSELESLRAEIEKIKNQLSGFSSR